MVIWADEHVCPHLGFFFFFFPLSKTLLGSLPPAPLRSSEWMVKMCALLLCSFHSPQAFFSCLVVGEGGEPEDWSQFILSSTAFTDFLLDRLLGFWAANASCLQSSLGWDFHTNHCYVDMNTGPTIALGNKWRASKPCCISSFHFDVLLPCCASWLLFLRQQNASRKDVFLSVGAPVSTL